MADLLVITVLLPLVMALLGLTIPAVSGRLFRLIAQMTTGLTLLHPDREAAAQAQNRLDDLIDFAATLGSPIVTIGSDARPGSCS